MGMARYAARCPSRVTRRVGYLLCLSILLGGKQKIRRISISSRALALITRKSIRWAGISTRRGGGGFLFRPVVDPMHVVSAVTIPPLPPPDRYRVRPWSRHRTLALPVCKARVIYSWKVAVSFFFLLFFSFSFFLFFGH